MRQSGDVHNGVRRVRQVDLTSDVNREEPGIRVTVDAVRQEVTSKGVEIGEGR